MRENKLRIFTWHVHGSYLYYLAQGNYDIYIPVNSERSNGYVGRGETYPFGDNVIEIEASEVRNLDFDLILYQDDDNYFKHQYEILSDSQRLLPKIYLEHDPPWGHPTDTVHPVQDPDVMIVHVTHFNQLMWDNDSLNTRVIEHGVMIPNVAYSGKLDRGIVVINNLPIRGRLLGFDIFQRVREEIPLDLVGMGTGEFGLGEVLHTELTEFVAQYRFFFNPIRYTSLGLAVLEAMSLGIPVVGLATTELVNTIQNGKNGIIHTDIDYLITQMKDLLKRPEAAFSLGLEGKKTAQERFNISRFVSDWENTFHQCISSSALKYRRNEKNSIY